MLIEEMFDERCLAKPRFAIRQHDTSLSFSRLHLVEGRIQCFQLRCAFQKFHLVLPLKINLDKIMNNCRIMSFSNEKRCNGSILQTQPEFNV